MIPKAVFARDSLKAGMLFLENCLHKHPSPVHNSTQLGGLHSNQEEAVSLTKEGTEDLSTIKCPLFNDKHPHISLDSLRSVPQDLFYLMKIPLHNTNPRCRSKSRVVSDTPGLALNTF